MAFEKRTWFARLGLGLNKFIIRDKDAQGKQELVNSPDSVTQQGDVISADNLNDLEDRIANAVQDVGGILVWENSNPDSALAPTSISPTITKVSEKVIVAVDYAREVSSSSTIKASLETKRQLFVALLHSSTEGSPLGQSLLDVDSQNLILATRSIMIRYERGGVLEIIIGAGKSVALTSGTSTSDNKYCVPTRIYLMYS